MRRVWTLVAAAVLCVVLGGAAASQGLPSAGTAMKRAAYPPGIAYVFVDNDLSRDKTTLNYVLPTIPPGPYAVSLFAGMEPDDGARVENLYCEITNSTAPHRVLVATASFSGSNATFVSGASSTRVTRNSVLRVVCAAEYGPFNFASEPLRVTFTRLASMTTQRLEPSSGS